MSGTWSVEYVDGTILNQLDISPERPLSAIDWTQAKTITLTSEWASAAFDVSSKTAGIKQSLRIRTFMMPAHGLAIRVFMMVLSNAELPVDRNSTRAVTYWAPNGAVHTCTDFECSLVGSWSQTAVKDGALPAIPAH